MTTREDAIREAKDLFYDIRQLETGGFGLTLPELLTTMRRRLARLVEFLEGDGQ